jgi:hypothetical protein
VKWPVWVTIVVAALGIAFVVIGLSKRGFPVVGDELEPEPEPA